MDTKSGDHARPRRTRMLNGPFCGRVDVFLPGLIIQFYVPLFVILAAGQMHCEFARPFPTWRPCFKHLSLHLNRAISTFLKPFQVRNRQCGSGNLELCLTSTA